MLLNLKKWQGLSLADKGLLIKTAVYSFWVQVGLRLIPFRLIAEKLNLQQPQKDNHLTVAQVEKLEKIRWSVAVISRRTQWKNRCLVDAIVAKLLLKQNGIPSILTLGLTKDDHKKLRAHAWLKAGEDIVTGEHGYEQFVPMGVIE